MKKVTVFHELIIGNGNYTVFTGKDLECRVMEDGGLLITGWETQTETGSAVFPSGGWIYACRSEPLLA